PPGMADRYRILLGESGGLRDIDGVVSQSHAYDDDHRQEYQRSSIEVSEEDPAKDRGGHTAEHCNGAAPDLVREPSPGGSGEKTHGRGDHDSDDTGRVIAALGEQITQHIHGNQVVDAGLCQPHADGDQYGSLVLGHDGPNWLNRHLASILDLLELTRVGDPEPNPQAQGEQYS